MVDVAECKFFPFSRFRCFCFSIECGELRRGAGEAFAQLLSFREKYYCLLSCWVNMQKITSYLYGEVTVLSDKRTDFVPKGKSERRRRREIYVLRGENLEFTVRRELSNFGSWVYLSRSAKFSFLDGKCERWKVMKRQPGSEQKAEWGIEAALQHGRSTMDGKEQRTFEQSMKTYGRRKIKWKASLKWMKLIS